VRDCEIRGVHIVFGERCVKADILSGVNLEVSNRGIRFSACTNAVAQPVCSTGGTFNIAEVVLEGGSDCCDVVSCGGTFDLELENVRALVKLRAEEVNITSRTGEMVTSCSDGTASTSAASEVDSHVVAGIVANCNLYLYVLL